MGSPVICGEVEAMSSKGTAELGKGESGAGVRCVHRTRGRSVQEAFQMLLGGSEASQPISLQYGDVFRAVRRRLRLPQGTESPRYWKCANIASVGGHLPG